MAVDRKPTVESLGNAFAAHLRDAADVRELWVSEDEDGFVVSIFTDEIDPERELGLYEIATSVQRRLPEALFEVHLIIPSRYADESFAELKRRKIPQDAKKVPLAR